MNRDLQIHLTDTHVSARWGGAATTPPQHRPLPGPSWPLEPAELAHEMAAAVAALDAQNRPATLVLSSAWCYVHAFSVAHRRPTRTILAYAFEEFLPVASEQLTAEFTRTAAGAYLGVAVETARVRALLDALAAENVAISRITIDVLAGFTDEASPAAYLWCDTHHVAVLRSTARGLQDLRVVRFATGLTDEEWRQRVCEVVELHEGETLHVAGCVSPELLDSLVATLPSACAPVVADHNSRRPWPEFDLARDALASNSQHQALVHARQRLLVLTIVALLVLAGGLGLYQRRVEAQLRAVAAWERSVFTQLFPGQPVPAGVALRLASERKRLEGLTGTQATTPAQTRDALVLLGAVVGALPSEVRLDLQEVRIEAGDVSLRGRTRDHQQAERIAGRIDALADLVCAAPRTNRLADGTVQFYVHAQREPAAQHADPAAAGAQDRGADPPRRGPAPSASSSRPVARKEVRN